MELVEPINPWDKQPGETTVRFSAFALYRDMAPALRTVARVAEIDGRSVNTLNIYSSEDNWVQRVEAYDAHADKLRQARSEEIRAAHDKVHIAAAEQLMAKITEGIALLDPAKMGPQYLPRLLDTAVKVSHLATGNKVGLPKPKANSKTFEDEVAEIVDEMNDKEMNPP